ncbi:natural product biosynthesis luciferase-like monooxygenase domain-containing protein [Streptosporangium canum]|uniref:Natural product biosynthesis luciferase-like monooxygenase domain-containing protein n=1 Tax=Streptosporangium canum TaxID=324952 RepID=A0A1I3N1H2_9ACTN|nr:MupA/Atu3671 family FMN-dependent luciferase-like monooxygenase [Streptosporangium canum]SFJ02855.1 natural product biosynthesis luciferase-like monooxygenase domain-containing protein [Streptosporangium canum]
MDDLDRRLAALSPERRALLERRLTGASGGAAVAPRPAPEVPAGESENNPGFSLFFFSAETGDVAASKYDLLLKCAGFADRAGFEAVWVPERHFDAFGGPYSSPGLLLAALAATTTRVKLRAGSVVLPLHDPLLVAEQWGVLDNLSGGRVGLSLASGWHTQDFALAPQAYERRREILLERLQELRGLWAGKPVSRLDGAGQPVELLSHPRPATARLPIWLTSSGNVSTWKAAAAADTHVLSALLEQSVEELADKIAVYRKARAEAGLDPAAGRVTVMLHTYVGATLEQARQEARGPLVRYLLAHMSLFEKLLARTGAIDLAKVTEADRRTLAEMAFERYFVSNGLFGDVATASAMVRRLREAGVNEIACLVDFGIPAPTVLDGLTNLHELARSVWQSA